MVLAVISIFLFLAFVGKIGFTIFQLILFKFIKRKGLLIPFSLCKFYIMCPTFKTDMSFSNVKFSIRSKDFMNSVNNSKDPNVIIY